MRGRDATRRTSWSPVLRSRALSPPFVPFSFLSVCPSEYFTANLSLVSDALLFLSLSFSLSHYVVETTAPEGTWQQPRSAGQVSLFAFSFFVCHSALHFEGQSATGTHAHTQYNKAHVLRILFATSTIRETSPPPPARRHRSLAFRSVETDQKAGPYVLRPQEEEGGGGNKLGGVKICEANGVWHRGTSGPLPLSSRLIFRSRSLSLRPPHPSSFVSPGSVRADGP